MVPSSPQGQRWAARATTPCFFPVSLETLCMGGNLLPLCQYLPFSDYILKKKKTVKVYCTEIMLPAVGICCEALESGYSPIQASIGMAENSSEAVTLIAFPLNLEENMLSPLGRCRGWWCYVFKYVLGFKHLSNFTKVSPVLFACLESSVGLMGFISTLRGWTGL